MRGWQRRSAGLSVSLVLLASALTACGGDSTSDDKTLTYWSMWTKPEPQAKVIAQAAKEFEQETGIKVEIKWVGRKVLTNVGASLNGGTLPDLTDQEGGELTATFGPGDSAAGLEDVCAMTIAGESSTVCDVIPTQYVERYKTKDGQPMMIPYEIITSSLWFNGKQLPKVSDNPPTVWDDWVSLLEQEKSAGRPPLALDGSEGAYDAYWWTWSAVRHAGVKAFHDAVADKSGKSWDDPALLAAADDVADLVEGGFFTPKYDGSKWPAVQSAWATGENNSDFLLMGSWAPSETAEFGEKNPKGFEYRSMPYPTVEGGKGNEATELYMIGMAIPKKAKQADNAKKFIAFLLNKDRLSGISTSALNLTSRPDIVVPEQLADVKQQLEAAGTNLFATDDGVNADFPQFTSDTYYPSAQKLLLGKVDGPGFIAAMKKGTIDYWKTRG
jgi:ABC-type glycerol-3-phosphate transport system substrate-binding protein